MSSDPSAVLNRLDWQLGEVGRRQHRFAWLRDTDTGTWLAVDSYYPGNRVVVLASDDVGLLRVCEALVPRNGLFLLTVSADDLATDGPELVKRLRARLEIQGWAPRSDVPGGGPMVTSLSSHVPDPTPTQPPPTAPDDHEEFDVPAGVRLRAQPRPARPRASESEGMGVGITLVIAVALELVVGGGIIGLRAGEYVLGFGFLLDACARVLGMIVASQSGDVDAAWTSVLFGSPALWGLRESEHSDLVPIARVTAILAGVAVAFGLLLAVL